MDNTFAYPGVPETLAQLNHMPMAVLTNKPERISVRILNSLGLANYFRVIMAETVLNRRSRTHSARTRSCKS